MIFLVGDGGAAAPVETIVSAYAESAENAALAATMQADAAAGSATAASGSATAASGSATAAAGSAATATTQATAASGSASSATTAAGTATTQAASAATSASNAAGWATAAQTSANAYSALSTSISTVSASLSTTNANVATNAAAIATLNGYASATYSLRVKAGASTAQLELVASNDPTGPASTLLVDASNILLNGTVLASHLAASIITVDQLTSQSLDASVLNITSLLSITSQSAGFSFGKTSAIDYATDGIFFGATPTAGGGTGWGFLMGKTTPGGNQQSLQQTTDAGLILTNAKFRLLTGTGTTGTNYSTSQTVTLPVGSKMVSFTVLGGGGGAAGSTAGTATTVQLYDGATNTGISWTSAAGATGGSTTTSGLSSLYGTGAYLTNTQTPGAAVAATGYGAGAAGAASSWSAVSGGDHGAPINYAPTGIAHVGGGAATPLTVNQYDISGVANPKLVITIGTGGVCGAGTTGGNGTPGIVLGVATSGSALVAANVVPLAPTATGTFTKAANATGNTIFPDLGPGMWVISDDNTTNGYYLCLPGLVIDAAGTTLNLIYPRSSTFIASIRPNITVANATAMTYRYAFYSMKDVS